MEYTVLLAGDTADVNGAQIHQDKLGGYVHTGAIMNGRAAYAKDNNTNHMLWFALASDGPTWYVGKREEYGQPRGWLQVKSDAPTPADIKGTWGVWVANEKVWKDARDVKCVAVSATPGVYIHGPTPNQLLQDKLGEYRRVQQRVVTERGVYEMVGMPNVMMWYAPGGTWNIGKRDELGQNRGWYQAVSKAISPEGITNWQVWDGANRKWEKALELVALSVGSKRVAFTGETPRGINADKLGEFVRRGYRFEAGRAVYESADSPDRAMWYCNKYWYIGQVADIGQAQGWLCCKDDAACPELCKAMWRVSDGMHMIDAHDVRCMPVGAMTVMVAGETPNNLNSDKLGEFVRQVGRKVNMRPVYSQVGNENRMLWYSVGYWYLGRKDEMGKSQGWLCVRDPAPAPELTQSVWRVGDGETLHDAPNIKCAAIGVRCIEVIGEPVLGLHKDKMGEFKMIAAHEVNGKPVYEKNQTISHMVWAANGYWYVGKRDELGKQAGWMQVRDSSSLPEEICGVWQIWNQSEKRWMASDGVKVIAVGNAQVSLTGEMPASCHFHADKLGEYLRLKGQEVNGCTIFRKRDDATMMWHAGSAWWVGPPASLGKQAGYWRCRDTARVPEMVRAPWEVGDGARWHVADKVRCAERLVPRLILQGATPEDRHQDKVGTYVLMNERVNDRPCYHQVGNSGRMIWFLTPYWYVGKSVERGLGQGWLQVRSLAHVPEQISGTWAIWNSSEKEWVEAPELKIYADLPAQAEADRALVKAGMLAVPAGGADANEVLMVEEVAQAPVVAAEAKPTEQRYEVYLLADAGVDGIHHARIAAVVHHLRARGLSVFFEAEQLSGHVLEQKCSAIDVSDVVIVCVSGGLIERVGGKFGPHDTSKREFEYAERTKGVERLVSLIFDPLLAANKGSWRGSIGMVLSAQPHFELPAAEESAEWEQGLRQLGDEVSRIRGLSAVAAEAAGDTAASEVLPNAPPLSTGDDAMSAGGTYGELTMVQKVEKIKEQLGLEPALNIARGIAEANASMGIDAVGTLHDQVERCLAELGIGGAAKNKH